jgi:hypothetical protein
MEKKGYWKYENPGKWSPHVEPNFQFAPFYSIGYGFLILLVMVLITILIPTIIPFDRIDIIILVIIDILWSLSAGTAIAGGILYDEEKVIMFGKEH